MATIKPMNIQMAGRIRSFLEGSNWWDVADKLNKAGVVPSSAWTSMIAGIPGLQSEDFQFAKAINWYATKASLAVASPALYGLSSPNWWYVLGQPGAIPGLVYVTGAVPIDTMAPVLQPAAEALAQQFVHAAVKQIVFEQKLSSVQMTQLHWEVKGTIGV